jgi:hypothetical protein
MAAVVYCVEHACVQNSDTDDTWLKLRRNFDKRCRVNGSDAYTIARLTRYKSPSQLFREISGQVPAKDISHDESIVKGHTCEPLNAGVYEQEMCTTLKVVGYFTPTDENPNFEPGDGEYIGCTPDRVNALCASAPDVEIKSPRYRLPREVPLDHIAQLHVEMAVRNKPSIHYHSGLYDDSMSVLLGYFISEVYFSREFWARLYPMLKQFACQLEQYQRDKIMPYIQDYDRYPEDGDWPVVTQIELCRRDFTQQSTLYSQ